MSHQILIKNNLQRLHEVCLIFQHNVRVPDLYRIDLGKHFSYYKVSISYPRIRFVENLT